MHESSFGLYLILTDPVAGYEAAAQAAVDCGVRFLQLRMKGTDTLQALETARLLRTITQHTETRFIINDDLELAMACDADGLHLGQDDRPLADARTRWDRPGKLFGLSTHNLNQALDAAQTAPDYIGIGPVFPTATKPDADPALGPQEAGRIAHAVPLPAVAIGGIHAETLPSVLAAGLQNFCVVGAVNGAADPTAAIRGLQKIRNDHAF